ncbi:TolC family protein [Mucilaginibacter lacusdianchii]|uniref:TolC family protein n=1 Tax=Mucilaginibacter lacusdianchii TaxID=2684211 RepID=UPI00131E246B|nr:TolC family protein [Mucilaginibacter sp. JXJ CY 39]
MNIRKLSAALLLFSGFPALLMAQSQPLTLKQCLQQALSNNQNIAISRYEEQNGEQQIIQTRSRSLPQVNATGNLSDNFKKQVIVIPAGVFPGAGGSDGKPTTLVAGTTYTTAISADVSQPLFDAAAFTGLKAATAGREYYKLSTKQTEEEVISQVSQAYYRILANREQIKVQDTNIVRLTRLVNATQGQYNNGLARKIDLDRIKVSLTNAQTQRTQAMNQIAIQTNQLKVLMGVSVESNITPADLSIRDIEERVTQYVPEDNFDLQKRTEILVLNTQVRLGQLQKKATQAENYPKLSAFFNYSQNAQSNTFSNLFAGGGDQVNYGIGAFGLRLNIPIFDGFSRRSRAAQNQIQINEIEKRREATALNLTAGFQNSRIQMANSISSIQAQRQNVQLAENVYSASQANYNLGLATLTDLLDAQNSFITAQNSYTQALLDYKLAEIESIRSAGNIRSLLQ